MSLKRQNVDVTLLSSSYLVKVCRINNFTWYSLKLY